MQRTTFTTGPDAEPDFAGLPLVDLDTLVRRSLPRFVLPWTVLPNGTAEFQDCRDKSRLQRVMRLGFVGLVWCLSVLFLLGAVVAYFNHSLADTAILGVFGITFAAIGVWFLRAGRRRIIELNLHGQFRIRRRGSRCSLDPDGGWAPARLKLCEFTGYKDGDARQPIRGVAIVLGDDEPRAALCAAPSMEECIDALGTLPPQVGAFIAAPERARVKGSH